MFTFNEDEDVVREPSTPPCPTCKAKGFMEHRCFGNIPDTVAFKRNGWYCGFCEDGPFQMGNK